MQYNAHIVLAGVKLKNAQSMDQKEVSLIIS